MLIGWAAWEPGRAPAVPAAASTLAQVPGLEDVRYIVGHEPDMARLRHEIEDTWRRQRQALGAGVGPAATLPDADLLALSGGGDGGAYGAGLLSGWSRAGNRPEFALVSGVSTGGLIAPFAFLGPKYDPLLEAFYTRTPRREIVRTRHLLSAVTNDAIDDTAPLRALIVRFVTRALLDEIGAQYERGRQLWISTVDIDARRRVIWNMTRIAARRDPRALQLFHDVMIASAAIPGAFPPVMIDVTVDGRSYQEMHVDGGAMSQVFVYPPALRLAELSADQGAQRTRRLWVILNTEVVPEWAQTSRRAISIAGRAIDSLIHSQGIGDLYRIYLTCQRDGVAFNLAHIPEDFAAPHREEFDIEYMRALFRRGESDALAGYR
ncbi:MAG: patatin-like phospholipase family protein, partial [Steroidobacteraceae bacterium]|nr:patatin-like phospholipase family protein [Steroidobacteraceae bacterium]